MTTLQIIALVVIWVLTAAWVGGCAYVYRFAVRADREFQDRRSRREGATR